DIDADGVLDIIVAGAKRRIFMIHTSTLVEKQTLVWPMVGANLQRTGRIAEGYGLEMKRKMTSSLRKQGQLYKQAVSALKKKQWSEASTTFMSILEINPRYRPAKSGLQRIGALQQLPKTIIKIMSILLIGIGAGWLMFLHIMSAKKLQKVQELLAANQVAQVIARYPKYIRQRKKYKLGPALVKSFRAQDRLDDLAVAVYQEELLNEDGTTKPELTLMLAKGYAEREKYDAETVPIYQEALKIKRHNPYFLRALGRAYRNLNQSSEMAEIFEILAHQGERDPEVVTTLAKAYLGMNRTDETALKIYAEAEPSRNFRDDKELVKKLAEVYLAQGKQDEPAIELYQRAAKWDPKCIEYLIAIAKYYLRAKKYQMVIWNANQVLAYSPANAFALRLLGQAYLGLQDYPNASTYLEKAFVHYSEDKMYIQELALVYANLSDMSPQAISIYQRAILNNPNLAIYHILLAKAYVEQGELDTALAELQAWEKLSPTDTEPISSVYEKLLTKYPSNAVMHHQVIPLYLKMGKIPEALHSLSILLEVDPNQVDFVIQGYSIVLEKEPKNLGARLERAQLYVTAGKDDEAIADYEVIRELHPKDKTAFEQLDKLYDTKLKQDEENLEVRFKYGLMLYAQGDIDRAIGQFQKTLRGGYRELDSSKYLGLCFQKKGMYDLAYRQLSKLQITDEVKESLYEIANQYIKLRQYPQAIVVFEQIYSVDIAYKDVKDQLDKLRQMPITSAPAGATSAMSGVPGDPCFRRDDVIPAKAGIDATVIEPSAVLETKTRYE
ncbi:MAG: tetratricopeptide repeat protein, partial [bacterium]|nr:tetratricopeptide repeat protein [bacterium]